MKKLFTILAMLMFVLQYSMAGTATLTLNGSEVSDPTGFFTHDASGKFSFNAKYNGATYAGISFTSGLKMEGTTKILFNTTKVSTVTIVQATNTQGDKTIQLDGSVLSTTNSTITEGTNYREYVIANVEAGDHNIMRGSGETGIYYVKVEWVDVYTATFDNSKSNWTDVYAYTWSGDGDSKVEQLGGWPGTQLTAGTDGKFLVSIESSLPEKIIFHNNSGSQTANFVFKNGAEYNFDGRIVNKTHYTATFTTEAEWTEVYAYCWNNAEDEEALGAWPGTKITATEGVYQISLDAEFLPEGILFHNNNGWQTPDYQFKDGATFEYNKTEYTATFTTDADWDNVYAWIWKGSGDNTINLLEESWPGKELTAIGEGVYSFTYETFGDAPEHILFNGGDDTKKTPDLTFNNGRAYKWNTTLEPLFALQESEADIPAGTTVNVKDADGDVVATLTYGVEGEADFNAPTTRANDEYQGFKAYTAGNGQNGTATSGTVYIIKPVYDGEVTVGVWLNAGKPLYIQEDGTSLSGFNGYKADYASGTAFTFPVKAGSEYKVYCTGSKLGFYGFDYKFEKTLTITDYYLIGGTGDWEISESPLTKDGDDYTVKVPYESGYSFAIAPNTSFFGTDINWKRVIRPAEQANLIFKNATGSAVTGDGSQNWKMRELGDNESNEYIATLKYNPTENTWSIECAATVSISEAGYATYSNAQPYKVEGAEVYTVSEATTKATFNQLPEGAEIPGGTGVILKGEGEVTITPSAGTAEIGTNLLKGSGDYSYVITDYDADAYIFQKGDNGVGFYKVDLSTLNEDENVLPAHKAFLKVSGGQAPFFGFDGNGTTGINSVERGALSVEGCYTLDGRRVEQPTKGLYIMNGKKVLVK